MPLASQRACPTSYIYQFILFPTERTSSCNCIQVQKRLENAGRGWVAMCQINTLLHVKKGVLDRITLAAIYKQSNEREAFPNAK